jgi:ATP-dependent protease HslVU (ClpYQ) peptidase subunit
MTTIAYTNGFMACDSKVTGGDDFVTRCNKIIRLPHGHLLGLSGDADERDFIKLMGTIRGEKNIPSREQLRALKQAIRGLLVLKNGRIFYVEVYFDEMAGDSDMAYSAQVYECHEKFAAMGNGFRYALGAMAAGATAAKAVEIACKYDIYTGPPVRVVPLKQTEASAT